MLTLADATRLIDDSADPHARAMLLAALGFRGSSLPLDATARERLGLPPSVRSAEISGEDGLLRALTVTIDDEADVRATIGVVARRIARRVPHLSWLLLAVQDRGTTIAIGTWEAASGDTRVSALVTTRGRVVSSDAETVCALAAATDCAGGDVMRHLRWLDVLGREAIARRFFRALERTVATLARSLPATVRAEHARELALLTSSRLLFLAFLETKGWLAG
ncbi:MAG TPA: hypothetical protein VGT98_05595, partial [Candidatus Elarobacter sp.]|nr:hypothetical protein [Candidatus Elarobacter sp.]